MNKFSIILLPGDGIGPEITAAGSQRVMAWVEKCARRNF